MCTLSNSDDTQTPQTYQENRACGEANQFNLEKPDHEIAAHFETLHKQRHAQDSVDQGLGEQCWAGLMTTTWNVGVHLVPHNPADKPCFHRLCAGCTASTDK